MTEALTKEIITLGTPSVSLATLKGGDGVHIPPSFSHVTLRFTSAIGHVVNLYKGSHPYLKIGESNLKLSFSFDAHDAREDIGKLFEKAIIAETEKLISAAGVRITRGKETSNLGFYYFEVTMEHPISGLVIDPDAYAHKKWFEAYA